MLILIFLVITINFYISFKLNLVSTTNFFSNIIIVRISQTCRLPWYELFACVLLHTISGIAWESVTALTSSCVWSIVHVGTLMTCCWGCWFQYQLVSTYTEQIYCALTSNSRAVIVFPSIVVLSCSVYAYDVNMIT